MCVCVCVLQGSLDEVLEECRVRIDHLHREHRSKEREKGMEIKEELQMFREKESNGKAVETKRKEFISQIEEMRTHNKVSLYQK